MSTSPVLESEALADQLERSYRGGAWHGPAISEVLAKVDAQRARVVPEGAHHDIFQLVGHIAFWLEAAHERIANPDARIPKDDWPGDDDGSDASWGRAREKLEQSHRRLLSLVRSMDEEQMGRAVTGLDTTVRGLLLGLLQHNAYHAGQIMLIARTSEGDRP